MIPVAIYARVSSEKQAETESIEHQISLLTEYMKRNLGEGYYTDETLLYVDEGISGYYKTLIERPAIQQMFNDAEKGVFKVALFKEISRIGRDGEEIIKVPRVLESYGVRVIATNDYYDSTNPDTKIFFSLSSVFAEKESEKISTRVSSGNREKARAGKWVTTVPIGYKLCKETYRLDIDEETEMIPKIIFDLYVNKRMGTHMIAEYLNEKGYKSPKGNIFEKAYIRGIIKNPVYIGKIVYGKRRTVVERIYDQNKNLVAKKKRYVERTDPVITENAHPPIIDELMYWKAQEIMEERSTSLYKKDSYISAAKHPLVGLLTCGICGGNVICQARRAGDYAYRYYKCSTNHRMGKMGCESFNIPAGKLEETIFNRLRSRLERFKENQHKSKGISESSVIQEKLTKIENEKKRKVKLQTQLSEERELYTTDVYKEKMIEFKKQIEMLENQAMVVQQQISEIAKRETNELYIVQVIDKISSIKLDDHVELRALFQELIDEIIIDGKDSIREIRYKHTY